MAVMYAYVAHRLSLSSERECNYELNTFIQHFRIDPEIRYRSQRVTDNDGKMIIHEVIFTMDDTYFQRMKLLGV